MSLISSDPTPPPNSQPLSDSEVDAFVTAFGNKRVSIDQHRKPQEKPTGIIAKIMSYFKKEVVQSPPRIGISFSGDGAQRHLDLKVIATPLGKEASDTVLRQLNMHDNSVPAILNKMFTENSEHLSSYIETLGMPPKDPDAIIQLAKDQSSALIAEVQTQISKDTKPSQEDVLARLYQYSHMSDEEISNLSSEERNIVERMNQIKNLTDRVIGSTDAKNYNHSAIVLTSEDAKDFDNEKFCLKSVLNPSLAIHKLNPEQVEKFASSIASVLGSFDHSQVEGAPKSKLDKFKSLFKSRKENTVHFGLNVQSMLGLPSVKVFTEEHMNKFPEARREYQEYIEAYNDNGAEVLGELLKTNTPMAEKFFDTLEMPPENPDAYVEQMKTLSSSLITEFKTECHPGQELSNEKCLSLLSDLLKTPDHEFSRLSQERQKILQKARLMNKVIETVLSKSPIEAFDRKALIPKEASEKTFENPTFSMLSVLRPSLALKVLVTPTEFQKADDFIRDLESEVALLKSHKKEMETAGSYRRARQMLTDMACNVYKNQNLLSHDEFEIAKGVIRQDRAEDYQPESIGIGLSIDLEELKLNPNAERASTISTKASERLTSIQEEIKLCKEGAQALELTAKEEETLQALTRLCSRIHTLHEEELRLFRVIESSNSYLEEPDKVEIDQAKKDSIISHDEFMKPLTESILIEPAFAGVSRNTLIAQAKQARASRYAIEKSIKDFDAIDRQLDTLHIQYLAGKINTRQYESYTSYFQALQGQLYEMDIDEVEMEADIIEYRKSSEETSALFPPEAGSLDISSLEKFEKRQKENIDLLKSLVPTHLDKHIEALNETLFTSRKRLAMNKVALDVQKGFFYSHLGIKSIVPSSGATDTFILPGIGVVKPCRAEEVSFQRIFRDCIGMRQKELLPLRDKREVAMPLSEVAFTTMVHELEMKQYGLSAKDIETLFPTTVMVDIDGAAKEYGSCQSFVENFSEVASSPFSSKYFSGYVDAQVQEKKDHYLYRLATGKDAKISDDSLKDQELADCKAAYDKLSWSEKRKLKKHLPSDAAIKAQVLKEASPKEIEGETNPMTLYQVGHLMDVYAGDIDRHEENWMVKITKEDGTVITAPKVDKSADSATQKVQEAEREQFMKSFDWKQHFKDKGKIEFAMIDNANIFQNKTPSRLQSVWSARKTFAWKDHPWSEIPLTDNAKSFAQDQLTGSSMARHVKQITNSEQFEGNVRKDDITQYLKEAVKGGFWHRRTALIQAYTAGEAPNLKRLGELGKDMTSRATKAYVKKKGEEVKRAYTAERRTPFRLQEGTRPEMARKEKASIEGKIFIAGFSRTIRPLRASVAIYREPPEIFLPKEPYTSGAEYLSGEIVDDHPLRQD